MYVFDLQKNTKKMMASSFGPNSLEPIIRWSKDSRYVSYKEASDIGRTPIYVKDIASGGTVFVLNEDASCNWFFQY